MQIGKKLARVITIAILIVSFYSLGKANQDQENTQNQEEENIRKLWDSKFLKKRPNATKPNTGTKTPTYRRTSSAKVKPNTSTNVPKNTSEETRALDLKPENSTLVGVTLWRLRPVQKTDELATRILVQEEGSEGKEFIPERIEIGEPLLEGQRVRLSIEVPQEGYLYIIDREKYIDGTYSEPYLIFPTLHTRGGDNQVAPGLAIEVPAQDDKIPYFRLRPTEATKAKYLGEELTILVSQQPIASVKVLSKAGKISKLQFEEWEKKWATKVALLTLEDSIGKTYTTVEKEAGKSKERALTQNDPMPQTLYQVSNKVGEPLLIKVPLEIKRP